MTDPTIEPEDVYLVDEGAHEPQTETVEDGTTHKQDEWNTLQATVDRLSQDMATRLSDKDRYIGQLERDNQNYREGQRYGPPTERLPQVEPDPVLDKDTAALFAEKYKEAPEEALVALAEHLDTRSQSRMTETNKQRDQVQQATATLQAMERNIMRQVDLATHQFGSAATEIVGDFLTVVRRGNGTANDFANTWLGSQIAGDRSLGSSNQGVYRLIELEAYRRQGNTDQQAPVEYEPRPEPRSSGAIMRPTAPSRSVSDLNRSENEIPIEDRIGSAIVEAARGDDAAIDHLFRG